MRIIIVGAGLGGLCAAFCFARQGNEVTVLERSSTLSKKGNGILVRPGASRYLIGWGLRKDFELIARDNRLAVLKNLYTGELAISTLATDVSEFPDWALQRPQLQDIFYRRAREAGARIEFGVNVMGVGEDVGEAWVTLADGKVLRGDLVLAADGIRSRIRTQILTEEKGNFDPVLSGITSYGVRPAGEVLGKHEEGKRLLEETNLTVHIGDGLSVTGFTHKGNNWNGTFAVKEPHQPMSKGFWDEDGDIEYVRDAFKDASPDLRAALMLTQTCDRWRLAELPDLPRWTSRSGRILLLGDSAHAMVPNAAQGFSQIVEDIAVLEYLLTFDSRPTSEITRIWEAVRKPRAEKIKKYAAANAQMYAGGTSQLKPSKEVNVKSFKHVKPDQEAPLQSSAFLKWVLDHDAVGEARRYVEQDKAKL